MILAVFRSLAGLKAVDRLAVGRSKEKARAAIFTQPARSATSWSLRCGLSGRRSAGKAWRRHHRLLIGGGSGARFEKPRPRRLQTGGADVQHLLAGLAVRFQRAL